MFKSNSSFLVLYTHSISITLNFFKAIGADIKQAESEKVAIKIEGHEIHFVLDMSEPFEEYKYIAKNNDYGNGVIFYVEVDSIEEIYKLILPAGGKLKSEIFDNDWNAKELLFEDPNGYKFAFYQMYS